MGQVGILRALDAVQRAAVQRQERFSAGGETATMSPSAAARMSVADRAAVGLA